MTPYSIVVADKDGNRIGEFVNWVRLKFSKRLNNYGECTFSVPILDNSIESLIALRRYEVQIYRDGTLVWAGEQVYAKGKMGGNEAEMVEITCRDFFEMFINKFSDFVQVFTAVDAGEIAWELIDASQSWTPAADLGITEGTIEPTQDRDRSYYLANVYDEIINLSNVIGGFDFEITDLKVFNVYAQKGIDKSSSAVFEWGTNIDKCSIDHDFTNPINVAYVVGQGVQPNQVIGQASSFASASVYGVREAKFSEPTVSVEATLDDKAEAIVNRYKQRIEKIMFTQTPNTSPKYGTILLGDLIRIIIDYGIYNINNIYRVYEITVGLDQDGTESIQYFISPS